MSILSMNIYNYFVTKRSLNNTPYRKFSLNYKQYSKTKKNMFKLNFFVISLLPYLFTERIWLNQKHPFADVCKIVVLGNLENSMENTNVGAIFNKVAHMLSYDLCKIFRNTYFPITPQN